MLHLLTCARDKRENFCRLCSGIKILSTKIKEFSIRILPLSRPAKIARFPEIRREILGDKGKSLGYNGHGGRDGRGGHVGHGEHGGN